MAEIVEAQPLLAIARDARLRDRCSKSAAAHVAVVHRAARRGREDWFCRARVARLGPVLSQERPEGRHQHDAAKRLRGLWLRVFAAAVELAADVYDTAVKLDIGPLEAQEFALAKAGEDGRRKQRSICGRSRA